MKNISILGSMIILFASCSQKKLPEIIASHYGVSDFNEIKTIEFKFNVQKQNKEITRHWKWNPNTNQVQLYLENKKITFVLNNCKSEKEIEYNNKFINDSYWLLFPYQLLWDKESFNYEITKNCLSPITNNKSTKITIKYNQGDGFTPNDIYELFVNDDNEIIEWIYRKNGSSKPTKTTTWEKPVDFNGVKLSLRHINKTGEFKLWFDQIIIKY